VYKYGAASPQTHRLQYIRKQLGYFSNEHIDPTREPSIIATGSDGLIPDEGSSFFYNKSKGISCIGAVPLIINFNIRYRVKDPRSKVLQVTQHIRRLDVSRIIMLCLPSSAYHLIPSSYLIIPSPYYQLVIVSTSPHTSSSPFLIITSHHHSFIITAQLSSSFIDSPFHPLTSSSSQLIRFLCKILTYRMQIRSRYLPTICHAFIGPSPHSRARGRIV